MLQNENYELMMGDCTELFDSIPDNSVDLILTDPPYGTVKTINNHSFTGRVEWDTPLDTKRMMTECHRVLRTRGTLVLFSQDPYTMEIINNAHGNLPFAYRYTWLKGSFGNPLIAPTAPVNVTEDVCVYFKADAQHDDHPLQSMFRGELERLGYSASQLAKLTGEQGIVHSFTNGKVFRFPTRERLEKVRRAIGGFDWDYDLLCHIDAEYRREKKSATPKIFNLPTGEKKKTNVLEYRKDTESYHPTQKPVALLEDLVCTYTSRGGVVLDFTMGSGSTGVAALRTGRKFIGIEQSFDYFGIACQRILDTAVKDVNNAG